jgi:hypothetical protein
LHPIDEQLARTAFAFGVQHLNPVANLFQIGRLGRYRENAVQPVDCNQSHKTCSRRAFAVQELIEFGQQLLAVGVVGHEHRERHAAQPVDVELVDQFADGTPLACRSRHHEKIAAGIGLGNRVLRHQRVEQFLEFSRVDEFERDFFRAEAGIVGHDELRLPTRLGHGDDRIDRPATHETEPCRLQ